jgi:hypothetical protein
LAFPLCYGLEKSGSVYKSLHGQSGGFTHNIFIGIGDCMSHEYHPVLQEAVLYARVHEISEHRHLHHHPFCAWKHHCRDNLACEPDPPFLDQPARGQWHPVHSQVCIVPEVQFHRQERDSAIPIEMETEKKNRKGHHKNMNMKTVNG